MLHGVWTKCDLINLSRTGNIDRCEVKVSGGTDFYPTLWKKFLPESSLIESVKCQTNAHHDENVDGQKNQRFQNHYVCKADWLICKSKNWKIPKMSKYQHDKNVKIQKLLICQSCKSRKMSNTQKWRNVKKYQIDQDAIYQDVVNVNMSNSEMVKHIKVSTYQNAKHVKQSKRRIYRKCTNSKTSQMSKYKSYQ